MVGQTIVERINERGVIIFATFSRYNVGEIVPSLESKSGEDKINHPFKIIEETSQVEYEKQHKEMGLPGPPSFGRYYYKVITD